MRVIDTSTYLFHEFVEYHQAEYAVLSHTWGPDELTYQDWLYIHDQSPRRWGWVKIDDEVQLIKAKGGYNKIIDACKRAVTDGYKWIWLDTICIDKTNLAELSETINSMYQLYRFSDVCYVSLTDVEACTPERAAAEGSAFRKSRWFTRGWTLQELLAPIEVRFFANDWSYIENRANIKKIVSEITNIPEELLSNSRESNTFVSAVRSRFGIAQRMSWVAGRLTTRPEDMAYSLLGLFGINMPLIYGEGGPNAMLRLQEEVIRRTFDWSVFAWGSRIDHTPLTANYPAMETEPNYEVAHNSSFISDSDEVPTTDGRIYMIQYRSSLCWQARWFKWSSDVPRLTVNDTSLRIVHTNLGLEVEMPMVNTMNPRFSFGILPHADIDVEEAQQNEYWMPLITRTAVALGGGRSGDDFLFASGTRFPANFLRTNRLPLFSQNSSAMARHVCLAMRPSLSDLFAGVPLQNSVDPLENLNSVVSGVSPCSILLTFPGPVEDVRFLEFWPPRAKESSFLFDLSPFADDGQQVEGDLAVGAIVLRHLQVSNPTVIFFAVQTRHDWSDPRSTCEAVSMELNQPWKLGSLESMVKDWGRKMRDRLADDPDMKSRVAMHEVKLSYPYGERLESLMRVFLQRVVYKGRRKARLINPERYVFVGYHYTVLCSLIFK